MPARFDPALPLYFQHIPKTAGTTVATVLAGAFPTIICPVTHWDSILLVSEDERARYRVFIGHYGHYLGRFLGCGLNRFTLLRDPVERTISHYAHILRAPHHPFHQAAKEKSLLEYVLDPVTRHNVENYQARYVADLGLDVREIAKTFSVTTPSITPLHMFVDELSRDFTADRLRDAAIAALDDFFLIEVTDRADAAMRTLGELVGRDFGELPRVNVDPATHSRPELDAQTLDAIRRATRIDQEIYEIVRDRRHGSAG